MPTPRSSRKRSPPSVPKRKTTGARDSSRASRYSAPALEKGLEIIEIVSAAGNSIKTEEIARAAGRSRSEIYRMLQVLESHGFIARELHGEGQAAEAARKAFIARRPMGRLGSAAEVAAAGLYLASDESGFMTGHALVIEGGFSL